MRAWLGNDVMPLGSGGAGAGVVGLDECRRLAGTMRGVLCRLDLGSSAVRRRSDVILSGGADSVNRLRSDVILSVVIPCVNRL